MGENDKCTDFLKSADPEQIKCNKCLLEILNNLSFNHCGIHEISEDEGSFNMTIQSDNSFNFDWTYTTIIIHNNMSTQSPSCDNTLVYVFTSYNWSWLSYSTLNGKNLLWSDCKELFKYLKIADLLIKDN